MYKFSFPRIASKQSIKAKIIKVTFIFFIFFVIFLVFINIYIKKLVNNEYQESNKRVLGNITNYIAQQINDIQNIIYEYSYDSKINLLSYTTTKEEPMSDDLFDINSIRNSLNYTLKAKSDILDICIYFRGLDIVMNCEGTTYKDSFFKSMLKFKNQDIFKSSIDGDMEMPITLTDVQYLSTKYFKPAFVNTSLFIYPRKSFVIMVIIDNDTLNDTVKKMLSKSEDMLIVYTKEKNVYFSSVPDKLIGEIGKLENEIKLEKQTNFHIDNKQYTISRQSILFNGMNLALISNYNTLSNRIYNINMFVLVLVAIFILFDILAYLMMNSMLYNPLRNMLRRLNIVDKNCDYGIIEEIINKMNNQVTSMSNLIDNQKNVMEENYLHKLLIGEISPDENSGSDSLFSASSDYLVLTCIIEDSIGNKNLMKVKEFEVTLGEQFNFKKIFSHSNQLTYFIQLNSNSEYQKIIHQVFNKVDQVDLFYKAGASNPHSSIQQLNIAYKESKLALNSFYEEAEIQPYKIIYFREEMLSVHDRFSISIEKERHLINKIINGDVHGVNDSLNTIISTNNKKTLDQQKEMQKYLTDLILVVLNSKNIDINNIFPSSFNEIIERVTVSYNMPLINNILINSYNKVTSFIANNKDDLIEKIIKNIEKNCYKPISLDMVADELNMSSGYISDYFRKSTGISFTKYIHLRKVEKAKEILKSCDKSVNDIAMEIGFENTNSFIRVFKQYEGVTPGQYRKTEFGIDQ